MQLGHTWKSIKAAEGRASGNDPVDHFSEAARLQGRAIVGIFDFRFSIVDLIKIRKSQIADPSDFTDFMDF